MNEIKTAASILKQCSSTAKFANYYLAFMRAVKERVLIEKMIKEGEKEVA